MDNRKNLKIWGLVGAMVAAASGYGYADTQINFDPNVDLNWGGAPTDEHIYNTIDASGNNTGNLKMRVDGTVFVAPLEGTTTTTSAGSGDPGVQIFDINPGTVTTYWTITDVGAVSTDTTVDAGGAKIEKNGDITLMGGSTSKTQTTTDTAYLTYINSDPNDQQPSDWTSTDAWVDSTPANGTYGEAFQVDAPVGGIYDSNAPSFTSGSGAFQDLGTTNTPGGNISMEGILTQGPINADGDSRALDVDGTNVFGQLKTVDGVVSLLATTDPAGAGAGHGLTIDTTTNTTTLTGGTGTTSWALNNAGATLTYTGPSAAMLTNNGAFTNTGNASIGGNLGVTGYTTTTGQTNNGDLINTGNINTGTLTAGTTSLGATTAASLAVTNSATVGGDLNVAGSVSIGTTLDMTNGNINNVATINATTANVSGTATVGDLVVNNNLDMTNGNINNVNTITATTGNITTVNATTGNITTVNSTTGNITTVNSSTVNTEDLYADYADVSHIDVSTLHVTGSISNYTSNNGGMLLLEDDVTVSGTMYTRGIVNTGNTSTTTLNVAGLTTTNGINNNGTINTDNLNAEYISAYEVDASYVYAEGVYADYVSAHEVDANHVFTDTLTVYDDVTIGGHTTTHGIDNSGYRITGVADGVEPGDAINKRQFDGRSIRSTAASTT